MRGSLLKKIPIYHNDNSTALQGENAIRPVGKHNVFCAHTWRLRCPYRRATWTRPWPWQGAHGIQQAWQW